MSELKYTCGTAGSHPCQEIGMVQRDVFQFSFMSLEMCLLALAGNGENANGVTIHEESSNQN